MNMMKKSARSGWVAAVGCVVFSALFGLAVQAAPLEDDAISMARLPTRKKSLKPKRVTSIAQLRQLLSAKGLRVNQAWFRSLDSDMAGASSGSARSADYSKTTVQVEGVDEGDIVKTDGQFIYAIQAGQVRILRAYPVGDMALVATLKFESGFTPTALYVRDHRLAVIAYDWHAPNGGTDTSEAKVWAPSYYGGAWTTTRIYDLSDPAQPKLEREVSLGGDYLSSRLNDNILYVIGRRYPDYFLGYMADSAYARTAAMARENLLPHIKDSAASGGKEQILPLSRVSYLPGFVDPNYVVMAGFPVDDPNQAAEFVSVLGAGDTVYATDRNLYLSAADYGTDSETQDAAIPETHLYKFALKGNLAEFTAAGNVPGHPLNQYSLDEYQDHLRIATTVNQWLPVNNSWEPRFWNNVYTLDGSMEVVGKLEHLAEGEQIYAARFMGGRGYLVTFQQTDPLFVIDLATPAVPKVLGELKIPGFSNYLQIYDDTHLIGIGQEVRVEADGSTRTHGMKLALFDVGDVYHPVETHSQVIGAQGTYSAALYDPKAVLFDRKRGLLGFPVEETTRAPDEAADTWSTPSFQGAHVYAVSLTEGFRRTAAITHMGQEYDWYRSIQRLLTIENQLYTLSEARLQANDLDSYEQTGALELPFELPRPVEQPMPVDDGTGIPEPDTAACTMDVKICPDGKTYLGRIPPACEFAPCPEQP